MVGGRLAHIQHKKQKLLLTTTLLIQLRLNLVSACCWVVVLSGQKHSSRMDIYACFAIIYF